ncbi:conserved hypothetical protein [Vibrio crassostreae]|nr:conserved hypothetical protein [Vibrio crassostreae]
MEWLDSNNIDTPIAQAARRIVDLKFAIDTEARYCPDYIPKDLHGPTSSGEYGPHFGSSFLSAILPFVPSCFSTSHSVVVNVPTAHVLGCSWRVWPNPSISMEDKNEVVAYINSNSGINDTLYTYIPELMIFAAEEGKNRVNFCRFHNVEHIPAQVMIKNYPSADRIKIYALNAVDGLSVWATLDGRYVKKVSHYAYALPVFRAYGVEVLSEWPEEFPSITELLQRGSKRVNGFASEEEGVDMKAIREQLLNDEITQKSDEKLVKCSLFELDLPLNRMLIITINLLLTWCVALLVWDSGNHEIIKTVAFILFGFSFGGAFIVFAPILKCKRGLLKLPFRRKN